MDNVQKHNRCINIPSSQTVKSYVIFKWMGKEQNTGVWRSVERRAISFCHCVQTGTEAQSASYQFIFPEDKAIDVWS
jgi:hypothetical protein